jgi:anti-anti-sigma factor
MRHRPAPHGAAGGSGIVAYEESDKEAAVVEPGAVAAQRVTESCWVILLRGEHDISTIASVRGVYDDLPASARTIVCDLTETTFLDSSVIGFLVDGHRRAEAADGGEFTVVAPADGPAARILDIVGVRDLLNVRDTRDAALNVADCGHAD